MKIKMTVTTAHQAFLLKDLVESEGLRADTDYRWRYTPAVNDYFGAELLVPATVEFDFQDYRWATYFQLKWAK